MPMSSITLLICSVAIEPAPASRDSHMARSLMTSSGGSWISRCLRRDLAPDRRKRRRRFKIWSSTIRWPAQASSSMSSTSRQPSSIISSIWDGSSRASRLRASKPWHTTLALSFCSSIMLSRSSREKKLRRRNAMRATEDFCSQMDATVADSMPRPRRSSSCRKSSPPETAIARRAPHSTKETSLWLFHVWSIRIVSVTMRDLSFIRWQSKSPSL
mmetsp:Transcript_723/g.1727  ORF Transcript_723/g.1727 Transcript_723/m.1727 type:complete len:215 (-) Transcript_723:377-1021(-)